MAESSIQEQFTCTVCGTHLIRVDVTAPIPLPNLLEFYGGMTAPLRAVTTCGACQKPKPAFVSDHCEKGDHPFCGNPGCKCHCHEPGGPFYREPGSFINVDKDGNRIP